MMVYRGFACAEEALNVLACRTVGGVKECPKLTGMALQNAINDQKKCFEGAVRVVQGTLDRKGIIEYTTSRNIACNFGTLCVIGGEVNADDLSEEKDHSSECGVFFYTDEKIAIKCFCLGYFYQKLLLDSGKSSIVSDLLSLESHILKREEPVLRYISVKPYIPILDSFFNDVMESNSDVFSLPPVYYEYY